VSGSSLNTTISLTPGTYNMSIHEWDNCGGGSQTVITVTVKSGTGVFVTSPANNSTVGSPANFVATATTSCSKGVASMGIYTAPYQLAYVVNGASLNTSLSLSPGTYNTTVEEWDNCGGAATTPITITVSGSGQTFSNLQSSSGWNAYAQQPPTYADCNSCTSSGPGTTWSMYQGIKNPSLSGDATEFTIGGTDVYSDVLFNNHLIGDLSTQGIYDSNHTLVPTLHTFTYDVYFYGSNLSASQALEFDINQFFNNQGYTWGHECRIGGGNEWDVWNNVAETWVPTGIPCNPLENAWNHLTIVVQRTSSNQLNYQSITLNGVTHTLNWTYAPWSAPGWYGVVINYQQDGNYEQSPYTVYVDKLNFTYE
jgi:major membrane immunogen (membrane-anchored lipoprotein)